MVIVEPVVEALFEAKNVLLLWWMVLSLADGIAGDLLGDLL